MGLSMEFRTAKCRKSTIFKSFLAQVKSATIHSANEPSKRLFRSRRVNVLHKMINAQRSLYATVDFVDIAGLVRARAERV